MKKSISSVCFFSFLFFFVAGFVWANNGLLLEHNLSFGSQGEDVKSLQEFLAADSAIYPEGLTTGYFGPLTRRAVERFQKKWGIDPVGIVGPITRAKIKELTELEAEPAAQLDLTNTSTATTTESVIVEDISPPNIVFSIPKKGELIRKGYIRHMRWDNNNFKGSAKLAIELVNINDDSKNFVLSTRTKNDGKHIWQAVTDPGEYKLVITATCKEGACGQGESEVFTITPIRTSQGAGSLASAGVFNIFGELFSVLGFAR